MKKMLMIAYYYPPRGGGGVQRTVKFTKYLPQFGIHPVVLTSGTAPTNLTDKSFAVANDVVHVPYREPGRILGRLYEYIRFERVSGWVRPATRQALKTIHEQGIEVIYSTASPYNNHVVALHVARELGLPWIADFRDLWTGNALYRARSPWIARRHKRLEETIYREATKILVTSPSQKRQVIEDFSVEPDKITIITNGFDAEDFPDYLAHGGVQDPSRQQSLISKPEHPVTIGYLGSYYAQYRPEDLLLALRFIKRRKPEAAKLIKFAFVGDYDRSSLAALTHPDLTDIVTVHPYMPHDKLQSFRQNLDANFVHLPAEGDRIKAMIPQKVFEYLATGKPIFAVLPPSDVSDLLTKHKAARIAPAGDPIGIAHALLAFVEELKQGTAPAVRGSLREYERKTLTGQLADVVKGLS